MDNSEIRTCCQCGQMRVTALVTFKQNISFIFRRWEKEISGDTCLPCMCTSFLVYETSTLAGTWWGLIGCVVGPIYIVTNLFEFLAGCYTIARQAIDRLWRSKVVRSDSQDITKNRGQSRFPRDEAGDDRRRD